MGHDNHQHRVGERVSLGRPASAAPGRADASAFDDDLAPNGAGPVHWARAQVGAGRRAAARTKLSLRRYAALTAGGVALSGVQLALLPRWLEPRQFGLVVLGISAGQGLLQFGDLGLSRLCIDTTRSPEERARLRLDAQALTLAAAGLFVLVVAAVGAVSPGSRTLAMVLSLGALSAGVASADKYRATAKEVAGDEVAASGLNFLWTNGPKIGLLVGVLIFRSAAGILAMSAVVGAALCLPYLVGPARAWAVIRMPRLWTQPFVAIVPSFVIGWSDTYFLSARLGVAGAGAYEALFRVLGVSLYFFLPWTSVLISRVSVAERRPVLRPLILAFGVTATSLSLAVVFVYTVAPSLFPDLRLPREALPGLLVHYLLMPVSYCVGSALYARGQLRAIIRALVVAMVLCLAGHVVFTLRGGAAEAAWVGAVAMMVAVALQTVAYRRSLRLGRSVDGA